MDLTTAVIGAAGLVIAALIGLAGIILRMKTDLRLAVQGVDGKVDLVKVEVDGKLADILELTKQWKFAEGKEAGRIEEAAAALVRATPAIVASVVPEVLPTIVKLVVEAHVPNGTAREGPEPVAAELQPAPVPAVLNLNVQPTAPTDLDVGAQTRNKKPPEEPEK